MGTPRHQTIVAIAIAVGVLGCSPSPGRLQVVGVGSDKEHNPIVFGVGLENSGETAVTVSDCDVVTLATIIFPVDGSAELPAKFEHHAELWESDAGLTIGGGSQLLVPIRFVWDYPSDSPELVAICQVKLVVDYGKSSSASSDELMFLIGSSTEAEQKLLEQPLGEVANAAEIIKQIDAFDGEKSPGVIRVVDKLKGKAAI